MGMNNERLQYIVITLLVTGLIGFGILCIQQQVILKTMTTSLVALNEKLDVVKKDTLGDVQQETREESGTINNRSLSSLTSEKSWSTYLTSYESKALGRMLPNKNTLIKSFEVPRVEPCDPKNPSSEMFTCDATTRTMKTGVIAVYSDKQWKDGKIHMFYIGLGSEGGEVFLDHSVIMC
jgi:hypothetical protein